MKFLETMINMKINSISTNELMKYADNYQIRITKMEAEQIANYLRGKNINIFNDQDRLKVIKEISKISGPTTAKQVNQLFIQLTK